MGNNFVKTSGNQDLTEDNPIIGMKNLHNSQTQEKISSPSGKERENTGYNGLLP